MIHIGVLALTDTAFQENGLTAGKRLSVRGLPENIALKGRLTIRHSRKGVALMLWLLLLLLPFPFGVVGGPSFEWGGAAAPKLVTRTQRNQTLSVCAFFTRFR